MNSKFIISCCSALSLSLFSASCSTSSFISPFTSFKSSKELKAEDSVEGLPKPPSEKALSAYNKLKVKDRKGYYTYPEKAKNRVVRTTSYSHQENEVGAPGRKNCIGGILKYNDRVRSAASDWSVYPLGTKFRVAGLSPIFIIDDYGSALANSNTIDIYHPTLKLMKQWGTRKTEITIIEMGDYERSYKILKARRKYAHCRKMYESLKSRLSKGEVAFNTVKKN